jgi:hypothetical protein
MFTKNPEINLHIKWATAAFGLSKMTVPDENGAGMEEYEMIRFTEFIEMIGRASEYKFKKT